MTSSKQKPDLSKLVDFALGHLSLEEAAGLLEQIESDPESSRDLELVLEVMRQFRDSGKEGETLQ